MRTFKVILTDLNHLINFLTHSMVYDIS